MGIARTQVEDVDAEVQDLEMRIRRNTLKKLERENEEFELTEEEKGRRFETAMETLLSQARLQRMIVSGCAHLMGGFGNEGTYDGDGKPSLIMTDLPIAGQKMIVCVRCLGEWRTPDPNLKRTDLDAYTDQLADWRIMLKMFGKSLSKPMGGPIFAFEKNGLPHHPKMV
jgi:hypothetical protein